MGLAQHNDRQILLANLNHQLADAGLALTSQLILDKLENWQFGSNKPSEQDVIELKQEIAELIAKFAHN